MESLALSQSEFIAILVLGITTFVSPFIIWMFLNLAPNIALKLPMHKAKFVGMLVLTGFLFTMMFVGIIANFIIV